MQYDDEQYADVSPHHGTTEQLSSILALCDRTTQLVIPDNNNAIFLSFGQSPSNLITNFVYNGNSIGHLLRTDDRFFFQGLQNDRSEKYDLLLTAPITTDCFEIHTGDNVTLQAPIDSVNGLIRCNTIQNFGTIATKNNLHLYVDSYDNHGHTSCSRFFMQGNHCNVMTESSLHVRDAAYFSSLQSLFNDGSILCGETAVINCDEINNLGDFTARNCQLVTEKIFNSGRLLIGSDCAVRCQQLYNQKEIIVGNNWDIYNADNVTTTNSSSIRVGRDWHVQSKKLSIAGYAAIGRQWQAATADALLSAHIQVPVMQIESSSEIKCTSKAHFCIGHHLLLKARDWIDYEGTIFETAKQLRIRDVMQSLPEATDQLAQYHGIEPGIFLHVELGSIKKSGTIIAQQGTVALSADRWITHHGLTQAALHDDKKLVIHANVASFGHDSMIRSGATHIKARHSIAQQGTIFALKDSLLQAPTIDNDGKITAQQIVGFNGDHLALGKKSVCHGANVSLEATEHIHQQGVITAEKMLAQAKVIDFDCDSVLHADHIRYEGQTSLAQNGIQQSKELIAQAPTIIFNRNSNIITDNLALRAQDAIQLQGTIDTKKMHARAHYITHSGTIDGDNLHVQADRQWMQSGGICRARNDLQIDALISLNIFGRLEATNLTINSAFDNNHGIYCAQRMNLNSLASWNHGLLLPKISSWWDAFSSDSLLMAAENGAMLMIPEDIRMGYKVCKAGYQLYGAYYQLQELLNKKKMLDQQDDLEVCDYMPLLCGTKNLLVTSLQVARTAHQTGSHFHGKFLGAPPEKAAATKETTTIEEKIIEEQPAVSEKVENIALPTPSLLTKEQYQYVHYGRQAASLLVGAFGPRITKSNLIDFDSGITLGVNGATTTLWSVNIGASCYANSNMIDTCYGVNSGLMAAYDLNVTATHDYTNIGYIGGVNGAFIAENLDCGGSIRMADRLSLQARKQARLHGKVAADMLMLQVDHLALEKDANISASKSDIKAKTMHGALGASLKGNSSNIDVDSIDSKLNVAMDDQLNITAQVGLLDGTMHGKNNVNVKIDQLHLADDNNITGGLVAIKSVTLTGDAGNTIASEQHAKIQTDHLNNQGSITGALLLDVKNKPVAIGTVDAQGKNFTYQGAVDHALVEELIVGNGPTVQLSNQSAVNIFAGDQKIHLTQAYDLPHSLFINTTESLIAEKKITAQGYLQLQADGDVTHSDLKATKSVGIKAGHNVAATSDVTRTIDGDNYQDTIDKIKIEAGDGIYVDAGNDITYQAINTDSGLQGTHWKAKGNIIDAAAALESYTKETHQKDKKTTLEETTDIEHAVSCHSSKGIFTADADGVYVGIAPEFHTQNTILDGKKGTDLQEVRNFNEYTKKIYPTWWLFWANKKQP